MSSSPFNLTIFAANEADIPAEIKQLSKDLTIFTYDAEKMMEGPVVEPKIVLCFTSHGVMSSLEIAQTLRMSMPNVPMFYVALDPNEFNRKKLIKNGFNDAYLLPWEKTELASSMKEEMLYSSIPEMRNYRSVKIVDLVPGTMMGFDSRIYLPTNNKFVVFAREGELVPEDKISKLHERKQNNLYIHKDVIEKFHEYTVHAFKQVGREGDSETVKEKRLKVGVRELVSDMFISDIQENTFKNSQVLLDDLRKTVTSLLVKNSPTILKKLDNMVHQESDFYGHLSRVATYCILFSIVLEVDNPVEVGISGLLHDIGLTALPPEAMSVPYAKLSPDMKKAYDQHPKLSVDIIRTKKLLVSERVQKAILHHHEKLDGSGTPQQLKEKKVSLEGQIVAIANQFDHLTTLQPNKPKLSHIEAFDQLFQENSADPVRMGIDIDLIRKLKISYLKGD